MKINIKVYHWKALNESFSSDDWNKGAQLHVIAVFNALKVQLIVFELCCI